MKIMIQYLSYCTRELGNLILRKNPKPIADLKLKIPPKRQIKSPAIQKKSIYSQVFLKNVFLNGAKV